MLSVSLELYGETNWGLCLLSVDPVLTVVSLRSVRTLWSVESVLSWVCLLSQQAVLSLILQ